MRLEAKTYIAQMLLVCSVRINRTLRSDVQVVRLKRAQARARRPLMSDSPKKVGRTSKTTDSAARVGERRR
jgi:hypothetical protein